MVIKINNTLLDRFVKTAGDKLRGDWVIIGGAVLQLLNIDIRVTTDIDIAGVGDTSQKEAADIMDIAVSVGLPVEAINQAAAYFLKKIDRWNESIVLVHQGKGARIFRPNVELFLKLKLGRMSESDLADCLAMLKYAAESNESYNKKTIEKNILSISKNESNLSKIYRLDALRKALKT